MNFDELKLYVMQGIQILKLDRNTIRETAEDPRAFTLALIVVAISGLASAIGHLKLLGLIFYPILAVVFFLIMAGVYHLLAGIVFKGSGTFNALVQVMGAAQILQW
ncbi:MAG: hypothetical protein HQK58_08900, partial [Deltaproteobacteria bacterium]|nr:hypothetical protein [Deltaproteobacteria bacterium]